MPARQRVCLIWRRERTWRTAFVGFLTIGFWIIALGPMPAKASENLTVFAAASLQSAVEAAAPEFSKSTGINVRFSFAGSSTLARQIAAGAPADVFLSANNDWMLWTRDQDAVHSETIVIFASNTLVLIRPADANVTVDLSDRDSLLSALGDSRLAIGDPDHVPAGIYAKSALQHHELWDDVRARLAPVDNVRMALALVARGETPLGIVYKTDAIAEKRVSVAATFDAESHGIIRYVAAATSMKPEARKYIRDLVDGATAKAIQQAGFGAAR